MPSDTKNTKTKKAYFIGIGGIGVSALSQYYLSKGWKVFGSDLSENEITQFLRQKGVKINIGEHKEENLPEDISIVIYSPAIPENNPELKKAKELSKKNKRLAILSYPQALGEITKNHFTIAVSGMHGKSTTSSMIALSMIRAKLDPTVIIGTKLKEFGNSNFRAGKSKYLVIEADEWKASFLYYKPDIIVLLNIEKEHLDFYRNLSHILNVFGKFVSSLPKNGWIVANADNKYAKKIALKAPNTLYFSKRDSEVNEIKKVLKIPGEHNAMNALACLKTVSLLGVKKETILEALKKFNGSWRRFEQKEALLDKLKIKVVLDYGHHPTELLATLKATREKFPDKKIILVFQPHQYQRVFYLFKEFKKALQKTGGIADKTALIDIFEVKGRETKLALKSVNSKKLVREVQKENVVYVPTEHLKDFLKENIQGGEVVIFMGAGDIYKISKEILNFSTN